jgi:dihydroorotase
MSFAAARTVLDAGLVPFTVGADIHGYTIHRPDDGSWDGGYFDERATGRPKRSRPIGGSSVFSLVQVMNELLALGIRLPDLVRMVTANAATMLGLTGQIGTLAPGAVADVTVLAHDVGQWALEDSLGVTLPAADRLRPVLAIRAGTVHQTDASLLVESTKDVA